MDLQKEFRSVVNAIKKLCCNLADLVNIMGGGSSGTGVTVLTGIKLLNSNGELFTTVGGNYRSVSLTIITAGTTGVTVATDNGSEVVNSPSFTISWSVDKQSDLKLGNITLTNDANTISVISYTYTA